MLCRVPERVTEYAVRLGRSVSVHATQRPTTATARDISPSSTSHNRHRHFHAYLRAIFALLVLDFLLATF